MNYGFDDSKSKVNIDAQIDDKIANKVDKVEGKGLSTNDFTDALKTKLDKAITIVDTALSSTSVNPVQNKVINTALSNKVDKVSGKGLSTNDFTATYKSKLDYGTYNTFNVSSKKVISDEGHNYYTASSPYTCPYDGYVEISANSDNSDTSFFIKSNSTNDPIGASVMDAPGLIECVPVRKGMKIWATTTAGGYVCYYPLTSYT